ncbi:hypothetical protein NLI96_g4910 [Meripilus lineatus]|uniref:DUF6535 domain-containing protein n=1 Tax=Meripilus lineatus TaxID=2056292 RepID=A0AAD5V9A2_9APHY|nr:hypothetical protein NLI96_g4910 [Physisporinus lineatus]
MRASVNKEPDFTPGPYPSREYSTPIQGRLDARPSYQSVVDERQVRRLLLGEYVHPSISTHKAQGCRSIGAKDRQENLKTQRVKDVKKTKPRCERGFERAVKKHPDIMLKDTNGWTDLSKTLHESDKRERKAVNENVDTIMVSVSISCSSPPELYSGSNPVKVALCWHRHSCHRINQVFKFTKGSSGGHDGKSSHFATTLAVPEDPTLINSTTLPAVLPPFTPDAKSKWVNAIWLAALAISLITASLGILIEQWFREYLAGIFVAPRGRYFRRYGLR